MLTHQKIFLASSQELEDDRRAFEIYVGRENEKWVSQGVFLKVVLWEDFLDAMSRTRLQDEYKRAIRECDLFVMLVANKVGRYTAEEFATAFGHFQATNRPFLFTYFKERTDGSAALAPEDERSVREFREKLDELGHFPTRYANTEGLLLHFGGQLDKLAAAGFVELRPDPPARAAVPAQKIKVGKRGVAIGRDNLGSVSTGDTHIHDHRGTSAIKGRSSTSRHGREPAPSTCAAPTSTGSAGVPTSCRCSPRTAAGRCSSRRCIRRC